MALIVEYHVNADMYAVGTASITAGMAVALNAAGLAVPAPTGTAGKGIVGIAGDSALAAEGQTTAYSASLTIGADGAGSRWTENRVSDFYNETTASQKVTVYNGGGKFWISEELFDDVANEGVIGVVLITSPAGTAGEWGAGAVPAESLLVIAGNQAYPSGVPGTATTDGSMSLGNYVGVICRV